MPELPDVEHERRFLLRHATGRAVERVLVTDAGILRNVSARTLDRSLRRHRFEEPGRHGKWLIAWTTGPAILIHFGMTGELHWGETADGRHRHDRAIFVTDRGELRYRNMRKLGGLWLAHDSAEVGGITGALGPDALAVTRRQFRDLLAKRRGRVKSALMDQRLIAGIGNILADEVLWHARIHPERRLDNMAEAERDRLHAAIRRVLRTSVERFDYVPQMTRWLSHVRGEPGARCPRCRAELGRTVVDGRTTYFCPKCQTRAAVDL